MPPSSRMAASILLDPGGASLKHIAWAYGCAKKGSDEERQLEAVLMERVRTFQCRQCESDVEVDSVRCSACTGQDLGMREATP